MGGTKIKMKFLDILSIYGTRSFSIHREHTNESYAQESWKSLDGISRKSPGNVVESDFSAK